MSRRSTTSPDAPSRRELGRYALLGGAAVGCAMIGSARAIGPGRPEFHGKRTIYRAEYPLDRPENITLTTCLGCHAACPVRVSVEQGVIAKLDGNPWSPRTSHAQPTTTDEAARWRGASCARGQARLQNCYDPHRILRPLAREGQRGDGKWLTQETAVLPELLAVEGRERALLVDPRQLDRVDLAAAFARLRPDYAVHLGSSVPWLVQASSRLTDAGWLLAPRWDRARAVLAWGADPMASGVNQVGDSLALARFDGPTVAVDPRLSEFANRADLWLPVRPGGDLALAWMLLRVWQESGLVELPERWKALYERPWHDLERHSGLGRGIVTEAAELLAEGGPHLAIRVGGGVGERSGGVDATEAVLRLAVLSGACAPGGAMEPARLPASVGEAPAQWLADQLAAGTTFDQLIIVGDGGLVDGPHHHDLLPALQDPERVRHLVVVTPVMNPIAHLADLVVPDVTELERDGIVRRWDGTSLVQAVVWPVLEGSLEQPWSRGLPGLLETLAGAPLPRAEAEEPELHERGWVPPSQSEPPAVAPFHPGTTDLLPEPLPAPVMVTFREAFGGFVDSTAQYWSLPSLRRDNPAWLHPETAEGLGLVHDRRVILAPGLEPTRVKATEGLRRDAIALAIGYGHGEGYDGRTVIDHAAIKDARRGIGTDVGGLRGRPVHPVPTGPEPHPSLSELLGLHSSSCERL